MSKFSEDIVKLNDMYKLPISAIPTLNVGVPTLARLEAFRDILTEEINEIIPIIEAVEDGAAPIDVLTALADLLGDIQVFCASEMLKFGLPQDLVLGAIMQSNFSKLGADGKPIYDERGKFLKGPNYWKPEPMIKSILERAILDNKLSDQE